MTARFLQAWTEALWTNKRPPWQSDSSSSHCSLCDAGFTLLRFHLVPKTDQIELILTRKTQAEASLPEVRSVSVQQLRSSSLCPAPTRLGIQKQGSSLPLRHKVRGGETTRRFRRHEQRSINPALSDRPDSDTICEQIFQILFRHSMDILRAGPH